MTIKNITKQIKDRIGKKRPETLIILGSGLGSLADNIKNPIIIPYSEIKDFPTVSVQGHKSQLICGTLNGTEVICMQGRFHLYEGHAPQFINTIIKSFQLLGIKNLIVTNAAGSLKKNMPAGSIMLITDHINFSGTNPLIGPNNDTFGPRFPDMSNAYHQTFQKRFEKIAKANKVDIKKGTYIMVTGPNFETAAEIKAFTILGADAVGMSTVPEVICAVHSGIKVLGISVITNLGTGLTKTAHDHNAVLTQGKIATKNLTKLVTEFVKDI